jgi:transposase
VDEGEPPPLRPEWPTLRDRPVRRGMGRDRAHASACQAGRQQAHRQPPRGGKSVKAVLSQVEVEIVKRSDQAKGFVVLPKRWVVERTLAWLNRCRRLSKDWESLNRKTRAFLLMASIRLMVRRLCRA